METKSKQFEYRKVLKQILDERQSRNASYSLRSFARDLDISVTSLSQVLSCKRDLSPKNTRKIAEKLCWSPQQVNDALNEIRGHYGDPARDEKVLELEEDMFSLLSEWYYLVILTLAKQKNYSADPEQLAKSLGIDSNKALMALKRLRRLKLIEIQDNQLIRTSESIRTTLDKPSIAIRKYHTQNFEVAKHSLENVPVELREISSMTMNIDPEKMEEAKKMLVDFKRKFTRVMEKGEAKEAYTLAFQFFPASLARGEES